MPKAARTPAYVEVVQEDHTYNATVYDPAQLEEYCSDLVRDRKRFRIGSISQYGCVSVDKLQAALNRIRKFGTYTGAENLGRKPEAREQQDPEQARMEWEKTEEFRGFKVNELRDIFGKYENVNGWKLGNRVAIGIEDVCKLDAAVAYFLADQCQIHQERAGAPIYMSWTGYKG